MVVALGSALAAGLGAAPARAVGSFSDSTFDTSSAAGSVWELVYPAMGDPGPPSCLELPTPPAAPVPENQCAQSTGGASSDGDGNAFLGSLAIDATPSVALLGAHVDASASYDPGVEGAIESVNVRFALQHAGSNAVQSPSGLETRGARAALVVCFFVDEFGFTVDGDSDGDGVADPVDNCTQRANPDQGDGDADLCGNACDGDCNGDGIGGAPDLAILGMEWGRTDCSALPCACDRNFDGAVGAPDLAIVAREMGSVPGPSGLVGGGDCSSF